MTTALDPRGRLSELYSARQLNLTSAAAAPTDTFVRRHFYDFTPAPQEEPQDDEIMGGGFANSIDARPAAPDVHRASARVAWPLDLVQIGYALTELLGAPATVGGGAPYAHTFESSTLQIPTTTFERKFGAGAFDGLVGAVCRSLQFPLGADRGFVQVAADYLARQVLDQYGASVAGAPTLPALAARVPRQVGTIKLNSSALGSIISGDLTIANVLGEDSYHGSKYLDDVQLEGRTVAINMTGRFKGAAMRDLGKVQAGQYLPGTQELEYSWQLSADLKLVITVRNVRFAVTAPPTSGPGRLDVSLRGRAEVGTSGAMVTAVLTNSQSAYS